MWAVIVVVAAIVIAAIAWSVYARRRRAHLRDRFGPEYGHVVDETGSERKAASVLEEREERVDNLDIHPLAPDEADRFSARWRAVQAKFVDNPQLATGEADDLVQQVMGARGYPVADFETRAADISVNHAHVVEHYRAAHVVADRAFQGEASTEDLRQALIHYRALFEDLLEPIPDAPRRMEGRVRRAS
jgi:hypothetical protein